MIKCNGALHLMARTLYVIMRTNGVPFFTSHEGQTRFSFRHAIRVERGL